MLLGKYWFAIDHAAEEISDDFTCFMHLCPNGSVVIVMYV